MIIGIAILLLGILFLIEVFNPDFVVNFSLVWPVILLVLASYWIVKDKKCTAFSGVVLFTGVWNLFVNLGLITYPYRSAFWPILLIIIGTFVILAALDNKEMTKTVRSSKGENGRKKYVGILSSIEEKVKGGNFSGADVYCIFGGVDLDLRKVELEEDAVLNVYAVFGGGTIFVSDNYNIVCNSTALFGGNDNKADTTHKKNTKTLTINCISFCGGSEIK